ncbi:MAG TPA: hypothetical protein VJY15_09350, partial [Candidatus Acidoferrum sp.]|nr:hypothetical protein [Candidatus Acidoferrum sp.]
RYKVPIAGRSQPRAMFNAKKKEHPDQSVKRLQCWGIIVWIPRILINEVVQLLEKAIAPVIT